MDPKKSGLDCILFRDLKVLLRQNFNSLSQVSVAACSSLSRPSPCTLRQSFLGRYSIYIYSVVIDLFLAF